MLLGRRYSVGAAVRGWHGTTRVSSGVMYAAPMMESTQLANSRRQAASFTSHDQRRHSAGSESSATSTKRFGMLAGALVFPVAVGLSTYFDDHREIFRPEYVAKVDGEEEQQQKGTDGSLTVVPKPSLGGPFEMRSSATKRVVNDRDVLEGKWTLLYFGFTKCAEICPNTMSFITNVVDDCNSRYSAEHRDKLRNLQVVFVTVDTVRDGPAELQSFFRRFRKDGKGMVGLYGDDEQTAHICKQWRVYFTSLSETPEEEEERKRRGFATLQDAILADDKYQFDHSAATYLVGPDGKLRDFFFREMGKEHAVERIGLHWEDAYGMDASALPTPRIS